MPSPLPNVSPRSPEWLSLIIVSSIEADLGLSDVQYQTCVSILFVGYVITGIPSNMLITRVKVPTFLVAVMMTWAAISIATGLTKNYMGLLLTRFFLGVVEAPYYPGEYIPRDPRYSLALAEHLRCDLHHFKLLHSNRSCHTNCHFVHW